ncbi:MAG: hypothetical protein RL193_107 [Actinomycetota bacterium]|jgi:NAD/NADP transhydrogenase beta subunit
MESLALVVAIVLFTSLLGGPVALLLTFLPDKPRSIRIFRTITVALLSLVGILFGYQLALGSDIPAFPRLIGAFSVVTSIAALLFETKVLKHKIKMEAVATGKDYLGRGLTSKNLDDSQESDSD